jgi:hypothetical protein
MLGMFTCCGPFSVPHVAILVLAPSQQYKAPQFYTHQFDPPTSFTNLDLDLDTPTFLVLQTHGQHVVGKS